MPETPMESPWPEFLTSFFRSIALPAEASKDSVPVIAAPFPAMTRLLPRMFWRPTVPPMPTLLFSSVAP